MGIQEEVAVHDDVGAHRSEAADPFADEKFLVLVREGGEGGERRDRRQGCCDISPRESEAKE